MPSQVRFRERHVNIRDQILVVLLHALLECLAKEEPGEWRERVLAKWNSRMQGCGFGLYDLDLEALVCNGEEKRRMLKLFEAAKESLQTHGEQISKDWLNVLPLREAIYFQDQETSRFVASLDTIAEMLASAAI